MRTGAIAAIFVALGVCVGAAWAQGADTGEIDRTARLVDIVGEAGAKNFEAALPADHEIEFDLYVPENYDPQKPAGLFVFISPSPEAEIPKDWKNLFADKNLIWASVAKSGNKRPTMRRIVEAIVAPAYVTRDYAIDTRRIYLAGFSGGGRVASIVAPNYADLFRGAIYICGVNPWDDGAEAPVEKMKDARYVFVSGTEDFNLRETREAHRQYDRAGLNALLQVTPGMGHDLPDARKLEEALDYLDAGAP